MLKNNFFMFLWFCDKVFTKKNLKLDLLELKERNGA